MANRSALRSHAAELLDPVQQAAHEVVHDFRDRRGRRGAVALAPLVGMNPGTLTNKVNPLQDQQLTLGESIQLQVAAGDFRILHAYAAVLGHAAYELPHVDVDDLELLGRYGEYHERIGRQSAEIRLALADRRVSPDEVARIRHAFADVVSTGLALLARFDALAQDP